MALLSGREISLGYEGTRVVEALSFELDAGDYLCVVGENGSGKTTLMKTILGLIPPLSGKIEMGDGLRQREIGYLPQQTELQRDFPASVWEIVLSGCLNRCGTRPFYGREERNIASKNLEKLGILNLSRRCYRELSGGQQQRVLLARALCATRRLLLLDEPVAGLDIQATQDMYGIIEKLNHDDGISVIMISHDINAATHYAKNILHIGSRPYFFGSRDDYLETEIGCKCKCHDGGAGQ